MIKGVNKKVVEINNPKSLYFEKAILYVRPNMSDIPIKLLSQEAQNYLKSIAPAEKKRWSRFRIALTSICVAVVAVVICICIIKAYKIGLIS